ncbi:hypothetical protein KIN20_020431 [Parelaphostrongylus tenuis]|uniref:Uncharacterized protein n=1 Tax=Parelaphostrongylus tenuis TaxID=148309 RepID=A0AAD5MML7_PARTN|nr:hypothetical protein KIN20_020431 [Parelaphostrongylus tenuis]
MWCDACRTRIGNFTISGFTTLPAAMARTITAEVSTQHPGLGVPSSVPLVRRLVMRAVFKVLQDQGRRALLPDPIFFYFGSTLCHNQFRSIALQKSRSSYSHG